MELKLEDANNPNKLGEGVDIEGEEVVEISRAVDKPACPPCKSEGAIAVSARPEIHLVGDKEGGGAMKEGGIWQFNFGDGFGCGSGTNNADPLTDKDTVTLCTLEETLRGCDGVEEHKRGGPIDLNLGPPFAVGDVIMSNIGKHGLQRAFVLRADHPRYQLRLADGTTVGTSMHKSWLWPRYATGRGNPNSVVPDQDNPFADIWQTIKASRSSGKIGSYGVLGDAQLESLQRIKEAKKFSKAAKADNADIPVHLWNERVKAPGISKEKQDATLTGFRKLGLRLFLCGLVKDCAVHMKETHGPDWMVKPRQHQDGVLTKLGRDQLAIANLLWHSTHTNWFEFNAGSRLVHLCFPLWYWRMARDGVPVWFMKPSLTTKGTQLAITDLRLREKTRE